MTIELFHDPAALAPARVQREELRGGGFILRHVEPLQPYVRCVGDWLEHWATTTPDAPFLSERSPAGGWRELTYAQTRADVGRLAQALRDLRLPAGRPVVALSDNAIDHAAMLARSSKRFGNRGR